MKKQIKALLCISVVAAITLSLCSCGKKAEAVETSSNEKVILILIDGMRPDGLEQCGNPFVEELKKNSAYTLNAKTVFPSVTLPCHFSLFYGVSPEKHKILTNTYVQQDVYLEGIFERLNIENKKSCIYYSWEPLREISRIKSITSSEYVRSSNFRDVDSVVAKRAINGIKEINPDFVFVYFGTTDGVGHKMGWMSENYLRCISSAINDVKNIIDETKGEYTVILTADHGGHATSHGTNQDEDMTIPLFIYGGNFKKGNVLDGANILDIAPTIADIMGIKKSDEWEGSSLISKLK